MIANRYVVGAALMLGMSSALAADANRGKEIYLSVGCNNCHGTVGQGMNIGAKLAPNPMPLEAFVQFVRTSDKTAMPSYSPRMISDPDLADVHAYLASIKSPDPKSLPLLQSP